jgi:DNA-binding beta-propeller fold protein YncE
VAGRLYPPLAIAIDHDRDGHIYIANTYHNEVVIYDSDYQQRASISAKDIPTLSSEDAFLPTDLCIKDGKLYVLNAMDDLIYVFSTL